MSPAALFDYSSRLEFGRRESQTSRRFAPGLAVARFSERSGQMEIALAKCSEQYAKRSENRGCPNPAKRALWLGEAGFLEGDRGVSESLCSLCAAMGA